MKLSKNEAPKLRQALIDMSGAGLAETGDDPAMLLRFLPLSDHARIFEPESFLIIGHRGAGKTQLFRALQSREGISAVAKVAKRLHQEQVERTKWLIGYSSSGTDFPAEMVFRQFSQGKQPSDLQVVWLGYLLSVLHRQGHLPKLPRGLTATVTQPSIDVPILFSNVQANLHSAFTILDDLDAHLANAGEWIFVSYDELDRVSSSDWEQLATIIRGLMQFWSSSARRWRRLRPKIFLRRDLYERAAIVGPDVSKISAQRLDLTWTVRDLYALVAKRFVNQSSELVTNYFGKELPSGEQSGALGWLPTAPRTEDYRPMVERMCGEYMGASASKGRTFSWIPTHLQDGHGQVLPRPFVRLFEKASAIENQAPKAEWPRLLHHSALRGALDQVSLDRMEEFKEELPWIETVRKRLVSLGLSVPIERQILQRELNIDWSGVPESDRPPLRSGYELVQYLGELGIFYLREDDRVDVRDIYLDGLGFKRKGGVKKPF